MIGPRHSLGYPTIRLDSNNASIPLVQLSEALARLSSNRLGPYLHNRTWFLLWHQHAVIKFELAMPQIIPSSQLRLYGSKSSQQCRTSADCRELTLWMPRAKEKPASSACRLRCLSCLESLKRDKADIALRRAALPFAPPLPRLTCLPVLPVGVCGAEGFRLLPRFKSFAKKVTNSPVLNHDKLRLAGLMG